LGKLRLNIFVTNLRMVKLMTKNVGELDAYCRIAGGQQQGREEKS
jgi:hypothetical protein